eukprot:7804325-Pyramimonas_sp.AAC.1
MEGGSFSKCGLRLSAAPNRFASSHQRQGFSWLRSRHGVLALCPNVRAQQSRSLVALKSHERRSETIQDRQDATVTVICSFDLPCMAFWHSSDAYNRALLLFLLLLFLLLLFLLLLLLLFLLLLPPFPSLSAAQRLSDRTPAPGRPAGTRRRADRRPRAGGTGRARRTGKGRAARGSENNGNSDNDNNNDSGINHFSGAEKRG